MESIEALLSTLLYSENDAWRDDAAIAIAQSDSPQLAEQALLTAIRSGKLDRSLLQTCAESLAVVWRKSRPPAPEDIDDLPTAVREMAFEYLRALNRVAGI
jgi:hypothetical protein